MTTAIILCAGKSSRLQPALSGRPKWMVDICGLPLLQHMVNGLHGCGVYRTVVLRSHFSDSVRTPSILYRDQAPQANMLATLMAARDEIRGDVMVCYGDLLCEPRILARAASSTADIGVLVDRSWTNLFSLRADEPREIAESCSIDGGRIVDLGRKLGASDPTPGAQYIGVIRLSPQGADTFGAVYRELEQTFAGRPWRNARSFEHAYMTDFLQELIDRGHRVSPLVVSGGWLEFDTAEDLALGHRVSNGCHPDVLDVAQLSKHPSVASAGGVALRLVGLQRHEALLVGSGQAREWRIPKGMLLPGERLEDGACREFQEETGAPAKVSGYLCTAEWDYVYAEISWHERCVFFAMECAPDSTPLPDSEHEVCAWVEVEQPERVLKFPAESHAVALALNRALGVR